MPNWCSNTMTIAAKDRESLETILGRIGSKESPIDFEKIIPQEIFSPEYQFTGDHMNGELDERNPRFDWYRWRIDNWGTKWNACYASVWRDGDSCARFEFDTAWSPATPVFRKLVGMFPEASIYGEYDEEGMGFHGEWGRDEGGSFYDDYYEGSPEE
nr:MAG TPA: Ferredoxin-like domain in Api92-like protein [Caudoviricetes sp.]